MSLLNMLTQDMKDLKNKRCVVMTLISLLVLNTSCNSTINIDELKNYVYDRSNGYIKSESFNAIDYSILYSQPQFEALKRLNKSEEITAMKIEKSMLEFDDHLIFYASFKAHGNKDPLKIDLVDNAIYDKRLMYLLGQIQNDFKIINEDDTINCSLHHFERGYGLNNAVNLTLLFPKPKEIDDITLIYDDNLFGAGIIKYRFKKELFTEELKLKYF